MWRKFYIKLTLQVFLALCCVCADIVLGPWWVAEIATWGDRILGSTNGGITSTHTSIVTLHPDSMGLHLIQTNVFLEYLDFLYNHTFRSIHPRHNKGVKLTKSLFYIHLHILKERFWPIFLRRRFEVRIYISAPWSTPCIPWFNNFWLKTQWDWDLTHEIDRDGVTTWTSDSQTAGPARNSSLMIFIIPRIAFSSAHFQDGLLTSPLMNQYRSHSLCSKFLSN